MSDLAVVDPHDALNRSADPGEFVLSALERGKTWLAEALAHGDLDALVNAKGYAETLRVATMQKQLGKDAELAATELVRRAERCIGQGVREGQEAGEIARHGDNHRTTSTANDGELLRDTKKLPVTTWARHSELAGSGHGAPGFYALADGVSDEQFEEAIDAGKSEENLSRANVVRKIKGEKRDERADIARELATSGHTTEQIAKRLGYSREGMREFLKRHDITVHADAAVAGTRRLNSERIVRATVESVDGIGILLDQVDYAALSVNDINGWLPILDASIRSLTTLRNQLRKASQP